MELDISGLAEAGLISSKLSNQDLLNDDLGPFYFSPERLLLLHIELAILVVLFSLVIVISNTNLPIIVLP